MNNNEENEIWIMKVIMKNNNEYNNEEIRK